MLLSNSLRFVSFLAIILIMATAPVLSLFLDAGAKDEDTSYIAGDTWTYQGTAQIEGTTEKTQYLQSHRSGPDFKYQFTNQFVPGGACRVKIAFAEIWRANCGNGKRVMQILINGEMVKADLDVFKEAGCNQEYVETFTVTADETGSFDIEFKAKKEYAMVSYIDITPMAPTQEPSESPTIMPTISLSPTQTPWLDMNEDTRYEARHECSFVQAGNKFYLLGGRKSSKGVDTYDYTTDKWSSSRQIPTGFHHFQAVEYEGLIWVVGALHDFGYPREMPVSHVYVYDPSNDVWMKGPAIPYDRRRGGGGLAVYRGKLYLVGGNTLGHDGGFVSWLDEYNPHTNTWKTLADAPNSRDHFHAVVYNHKLYAVGGRKTTAEHMFEDTIGQVDVFDFTTGEWLKTDLPDDLPKPRAGAATAVFNGKIMVMGGESGEQEEAHDDVHELDPATGKWSTRAPMNHPRHGTQAIVSGNGVYIAAGSPVRGGANQKNMEVFNKDEPSGEESTPGVLSGPNVSVLLRGAPKTVTIQHVGGNQGVFVQSIRLSGKSASDFLLAGSDHHSLLVGQGSNLDVPITYMGSTDGATAQLDVTYSGNHILSIPLIGGNIRSIYSPTSTPTARLTASPSLVPTMAPTESTVAPSSIPTIEVGGAPPQMDSTPMPSAISTGMPSSIPTRRPSKSPSFSPSRVPSFSPSDSPSFSPSESPSVRPSSLLDLRGIDLSPATHTVLVATIDAGVKGEDISMVVGETWRYNAGNAVAINGTETPEYFQTHRSAKTFSYIVDALKPGATYAISLGFAETWHATCKTGERIMQIRINDEMVSSDLDVFDKAGACNKALMETFTATADDQGEISVEFSATKENAMVSLIKVYEVVDGTAPPTSQPTSSQAPSLSPTLSPSTSPTTAPSASPTVKPTLPSGPLAASIDAGSMGEDDSKVSGDKTWTYSVKDSVDIDGTETPEYFRSHRSAKKFTYTLDALHPGVTYDVALGFAETWKWTCRTGERVMQIRINDELVSDHLDVFDKSGCNTALVETFRVEADDKGEIKIDFDATKENAMVSLIQVFQVGTSPPTIAIPPTASPTQSPTPFPTVSPTPSPTAKPSLPSGPLATSIDAGSKGEDTSNVNGDKTWTYSARDSVVIDGTETPEDFRTHRSAKNFTYTLDALIPGASYDVALGFAETWKWTCRTGERIMQIRINDELVSDHLDVFDKSGCNAALVETFRAEANEQGEIRIEFSATKENAMVSLIQLYEIGDGIWMPKTTDLAPVLPAQSSITIDAGGNGEDKSRVTEGTWSYSVRSNVAIAGTDTPAYYRSHRSAKSFTYTIDALVPGASYDVSLGFAETWYLTCRTGERIMQIRINDELVVDDLDVFGKVGCNAALLETFTTVSNDNGEVIIEFGATVENAMVSLIEVHPASVGSTPAATSGAPVAPTPAPTPTPTTRMYLRSTGPSVIASPNPIRVLIDTGADGEDTSRVSGSSWRSKLSQPVEILKTDTPSYFLSHRTGPNFTYTLDNLVPGAMYEIEFGFAEIWNENCAYGKRTMAITLNGNLVNPNLDVYKEVGCRTAHVETHSVEATSTGRLVVDFAALSDSAMVSYIAYNRI